MDEHTIRIGDYEYIVTSSVMEEICRILYDEKIDGSLINNFALVLNKKELDAITKRIQWFYEADEDKQLHEALGIIAIIDFIIESKTKSKEVK